MDNLLEKIENDYAKFYGIEYIFSLHNNTIINLKLKKKNLPHLIGLHKLSKYYYEIRQMTDKNNYTVTTKNIFEVLKENDIGYSDFKECLGWTIHLQNRMENFTYEKLNSILRKATKMLVKLMRSYLKGYQIDRDSRVEGSLNLLFITILQNLKLKKVRF